MPKVLSGGVEVVGASAQEVIKTAPDGSKHKLWSVILPLRPRRSPPVDEDTLALQFEDGSVRGLLVGMREKALAAEAELTCRLV